MRTAENMLLLHQMYVKPLLCYHRASKVWKVDLLHSFPFRGCRAAFTFSKRWLTSSPCQSVVQRTLGAAAAQRQPSCLWAHGWTVFVTLWGGVLVSFTVVQWACHFAKGCHFLFPKLWKPTVFQDPTVLAASSPDMQIPCTSTYHGPFQYSGPLMRWRTNTQCLMSLRS